MTKYLICCRSTDILMKYSLQAILKEYTTEAASVSLKIFQLELFKVSKKCQTHACCSTLKLTHFLFFGSFPLFRFPQNVTRFW